MKETLSLCSDNGGASSSTGSSLIPTSLSSDFVKPEKSIAIAQHQTDSSPLTIKYTFVHIFHVRMTIYIYVVEFDTCGYLNPA